MRLVVRKPGKGLERLPLGNGNWYDMNGQKLWVWRFDAKAISDYLRAKGFKLIHHRLGELSEVQRRTTGSIRNFLLGLNNFAYRANLPVGFAVSQLMVFEKSPK